MQISKRRPRRRRATATRAYKWVVLGQDKAGGGAPYPWGNCLDRAEAEKEIKYFQSQRTYGGYKFSIAPYREDQNYVLEVGNRKRRMRAVQKIKAARLKSAAA